MPTPDVQRWIDKLEIRQLIERVMRYMDDDDGERVAELFAEDVVLQLAGTVFTGREVIRDLFGRGRPAWTETGELLKHRHARRQTRCRRKSAHLLAGAISRSVAPQCHRRLGDRQSNRRIDCPARRGEHGQRVGASARTHACRHPRTVSHLTNA